MVFRPYWLQFGIALFLIIIQATIPGLLTLLIQQILDEALIAGNERLISLLPLILIGLYAINGALTFTRGLMTRKIAITAVCDLRNIMMANI